MELTRPLISLFVFLDLIACKASSSKVSEVSADQVAKAQTADAFNLATYIREAPGVSQNVKKYIAAGDAYLFVGDESKYDVQTNATIKTQGDPGLFTSSRGISANNWLDAHVFGQRLGKKAGGRVVDLGGSADFDDKAMQVYFRFMGKDIYAGKVDSIYENKIVRDLSTDLVYYPLPLLGLKVGGNIGGEIGIKSEIGLRQDDTLNLSFTPTSLLHASLGAGLETLAFLSAEVRGQIDLLKLAYASSSNLGYLPQQNLIYGTHSLNADDMYGIDGKIDIIAKAGVNALPAGVDALLWKPLADKLSNEWTHNVWNPEPIVIRKLPSFKSLFMKFKKKPSDLADCNTKVQAASKTLEANQSRLGARVASLDGLEKTALETDIKQLVAIKQQVAGYCSTL